MGRFSLKKIFYNDQILKLFSIIAAILAWFIIVTNISPDYNRRVSSVNILKEIRFSSDRFAGYSVYGSDPESISVYVTGPRYLIGRLSADDFVVRPMDLKITGEGYRETNVDVQLAAPDSRIKILRFSPASLKLYYAKTLKRQIPVKIALQQPNTADGYIVGAPEANPSTVTVTGPEGVVSDISFAQAQFSLAGNADRKVSGQTDLMLINSANKVVDTKYLLISDSKANITVPVLKKKTIPFKINFINAPAGFSMSNIQCNITSPYVNAAAEESLIQNISSITLADVDIRTLNLQNSFKFQIHMPKDVTKIDSMEYDTVSVNLLNTGTKTVDAESISAANLNSGQGVYVKTSKISGVQIFGHADTIKNVTKVTGLVNMANYKGKTGWFEADVDIKIPGVPGAWAKSGYKAEVYAYQK